MTVNTHAHITSWAVAIILFVIAATFLNKAGKEKSQKIVKMILRLFYLFILATGLLLLFGGVEINGEYIGKAILGVLTIGFMEMILVRSSKQKPTGLFWGLFIVVLILTIALGMKLPLGIWRF
ncbi:YisL family protein [Fredinandcohnia sp. QZ13]|uniref:YisL family protein n=1 Tax=Fredinandcohnia sp. QZ13 TaxID=3073144 RepID=UPI002853273F|nr:YisL family protein [Fredinandcohnia sp. QZ13]MDR4887092.1 YisL family protein [Fredinandcohnia sp. QZ13]